MTSTDSTGMVWRKSSRSGSDTNCVEVAELPLLVAVRDSKDPDGPTLIFSRRSWSDLMALLQSAI
ncbi:DUF397 domain-containing protein [Plantactinospora sp. B6F1]|uniref:DUF397 domain-containing protein n=1 Tax=Plantactinospora sp. B6F1 TaxID=3158971 RepID=UPI0032D8CC9F